LTNCSSAKCVHIDNSDNFTGENLFSLECTDYESSTKESDNLIKKKMKKSGVNNESKKRNLHREAGNVWKGLCVVT
ncbi:985_t:CDS:1, partial [Diversispora eburnea]